MTGGRGDLRAPTGAGPIRCVTLIVPGDPDQPTGGYRYDARVAAELGRLGVQVDVIGLPGRFPDADEQAGAALDSALGALPDGHLTIVDGLALGGLPEVARRHAGRLALIALVHHPLADETGTAPELRRRFLDTEAQALAVCRRIVTTSGFTARRLSELGLAPTDAQRDRIRVVPPGVDPATPRARRDSTVQRLLCVGSLVPRKGQDLLVEALAGLQEYPWTLRLVGDPDRAPGYAEALRANIDRHGLADRIELCGVQDTKTLDATYRDADLLVIPSHYEGYGMVVTEALARALPMITTTGGALVDTVPPAVALQIPAGDADALAEALRRWFGDVELRAEKQSGAEQARGSLADWATTGRRFAEALELVHSEPDRESPAA